MTMIGITYYRFSPQDRTGCLVYDAVQLFLSCVFCSQHYLVDLQLMVGNM
jgi:hypothetical protein